MKWEYKTGACKDKELEEYLNRRGKEGWELVSAVFRKVWEHDTIDAEPGSQLIFKREVKSNGKEDV